MQNLHFCFASIHHSLPSLTALHPILFSIIEKKIKCFGTVEVVLHGLALLFFLPWCNSLFPSLTHLHSFKSHILCSTQGMVLHGVYLLHSSLNALIWSHFYSSLTLSEMLPLVNLLQQLPLALSDSPLLIFSSWELSVLPLCSLRALEDYGSTFVHHYLPNTRNSSRHGEMPIRGQWMADSW